MAILFHEAGITHKIKAKRRIREWIIDILRKEKKKEGNINIILTSDNYLLEINKNYFSRDYLTDIISFDYTENNIISGDLFISIERVKANAREYEQKFEEELCRVIAHGILHLSGYKDKNEYEKDIMRKLEDHYLKEIR